MERLKIVREQAGVTQREVADFLNLNRTTYNKYENGASTPTPEILARIADFFHVSVDYLLERDETPTPSYSDIPDVRQIKKKKIPVLGEIACGKPIFADEQRDYYVSVTEELVCDYALIARGDSMLPRIHDGDLVFIQEMPVVPNGRIAAVLIEDEATLKRVFFDAAKQRLTLTPDNPAFAPLVYVGEELLDIRIMGLAIAAQTIL
ncbi:MAG: helix-turn-helix domain-containing protein [Clostridia bacterium]|nr:helix-turn-helix domain-containing protein [Clostridia bacterium]